MPPRRSSTSNGSKAKSLTEEPKRSTIRFTCTRFNSSAFCENANPDEDWTKIPDLAERRRIQNRIAQRNYRKKLKQRMEDASNSDNEGSGSESTTKNNSQNVRKMAVARSMDVATGAPRSQPISAWDFQQQMMAQGGTAPSSLASSPIMSDAGSVFGGRNNSYSPPALSPDDESIYGSYRPHSSSTASNTPFPMDDFTMTMNGGAIPTEDAFVNDLSGAADWTSFDGGFSFDQATGFPDAFDQRQSLYDPLTGYPQTMNPVFVHNDPHQSTLKSDPMLGFPMEPSTNDFFAPTWPN